MTIISTIYGITASYTGASQGVIIDLPSNLSWDGFQNENIFGVQAVLGSAYNDVMYGKAGNIVLDGGPAGADTIYGAAGNTVSYLTSSTSTGVYIDLTAGTSWDGQYHDNIYNFHNVIGSWGSDTIFGTSGNDTIDGGPGGSDTLYGFDGNDTVSYALSQRPVYIDLGAQVTWDGVDHDYLFGIENATGSNYNDNFFGTPFVNNVFNGGAGSDTVWLTNSYSSKFGSGAYVDLHDSQNGWASSVSPSLNSDHDTLISIENVVGSPSNDYFISGPESNTFDGQDNTSPGPYGPGGDWVDYSYSASPVIIDLSANASWDGRVNDYLYNIENVKGSQFNDTIYSSNAPNILYGGNGSDIYVFKPNFSSDTIGDLTNGSDHIRFVNFGSINYSNLQITPDLSGGSDIRVIGDPNGSDIIHVLDMTPAQLTPSWFILS